MLQNRLEFTMQSSFFFVAVGSHSYKWYWVGNGSQIFIGLED